MNGRSQFVRITLGLPLAQGHHGVVPSKGLSGRSGASAKMTLIAEHLGRPSGQPDGRPCFSPITLAGKKRLVTRP